MGPDLLSESNPFASRWVRPGAVPYLFPAGATAATLLDRLRAQNWWGQIVGPHGSGKSTLLAALLTELRQAGKEPLAIALHDGARGLPEPFAQALTDPARSTQRVVVIDGYEQLRWWRRWRVEHQCSRSGQGLLVTVHRALRLPILCRTAVTEAVAATIVARLQAGRPPLISPQEARVALRAHHGNLREALFDLYDLYERRR